eukprot:1183418-Prorocentrum_minimum.AAC.5
MPALPASDWFVVRIDPPVYHERAAGLINRYQTSRLKLCDCSHGAVLLGWAAFEGKCKVAETLHVEGGADLLAEDSWSGFVPRQLAENNGQLKTARLLSELARGKWLNIQKLEGFKQRPRFDLA